MTVRLRATWNLPANEAAEPVEGLRLSSHAAAIRALPGLRRHDGLRFLRDPKGGPPLWWRGEELWFDDVEALDRAAASDAWTAAWQGDFDAAIAGPRIHVFTVEEEFVPDGAPPPGPVGQTTALSGIWQAPAERVPAEIDAVYHEVHVPGVRALPRLRRHTKMAAVDWPAGEHSRAHRAAEIRFATTADFDAVFDTPEYDAIRHDGFNASVAGPDVDIYVIDEEWEA